MKQPKPVKNDYPASWSLVKKDIDNRDAFGKKKYGVHLQPFNGRDMIRDIYEELLDAVVYIRSLLYERDGK